MTTTTNDYQFEPIKGYPMLNWKGKRPFTSTHYYPAQLKERHGTAEGWLNKIFWGDNLQVMGHLLKEFRGKVNLVYIDPPFDSKADYKKKISLKGQQITNDQNAFEEKQYTDIWSNDEYLQFMYERLILIRELLADNGSIYLHCDWHKSHHLRYILDEIFGVDKFRSEVIWQRFNFHADANKYGTVHDNILFYSKNNNYKFEKQYVKLGQRYIESHFREDEEGRLFTLDNLTAAGHGKKGEAKIFLGEKIEPPPGTHWRYSQEKINELLIQGLIVLGSSGKPRLKRYLDDIQGSAVHTIWSDISAVNSQANDRFDYPTQKPEALLERIIKASSNPGDLVFDCFMGSGTTQAVAMKLGRRFIGADINLGAVEITTKRLLTIAQQLDPNNQQKELIEEEPTTYYTGIEIYNVNHYDIFRNPLEAKDLLLEALEVQPLDKGSLFDGERDGRMIKIMPVNRIATRKDLNELIAGLDYKSFEKRQADNPNKAVEKITLVCMGHEPDLRDILITEALPYKLDVEVVDILRDRKDIIFKRDSEARIDIKDNHLIIESFYPMNLLQKLSQEQEKLEDWRVLVESIKIDWNYDGAILEPQIIDLPDKNNLVKGRYEIPKDAGTIRIKITDLLCESLEVGVQYG